MVLQSRAGLPEKKSMSDFVILWLSILEKYGLNVGSVFNKGLCISKVSALWSKSTLQHRRHKQDCFEIILQEGECLHGQIMFFVQSTGSPKRDISVQKFFIHLSVFSFLIKHVTSPYEKLTNVYFLFCFQHIQNENSIKSIL